jgi:hypothetical protein
MELIKRCPTCGAENKLSEMMCSRCFGDVSGVAPSGAVDLPEPPKPVEPVRQETLTLRFASGETILVKDGDVIGRSAVGAGLLSHYEKVSRQHLQFQRVEDHWTVKDLGSANGTYLDDVRAHSGETVAIAPGQRIRLSSTLELTVARE